jgi:hypothetical protein
MSIPSATQRINASHIYLLVNNQQQGPYALEQIRNMWSAGTITSDTLYWYSGMEIWANLQNLLNPPSLPVRALPPRSVAPPKAPIKLETKIEPQTVKYNPMTNTFSGTLLLMTHLAIKAVQSFGWKIDSANEALGLITFQTARSWGSWNGVTCSLYIERITDNNFRVRGTGKQNLGGSQLVALDLFGESKNKADKAIKRMQELAK